MNIPLKAKYRVGGKSRYKSPAGTGQPKRKRKKTKNAVPGRKRLRVMTGSGRTYMTDYESYYAAK